MAHAVNVNGVAIYNLSAGKTLPQWMSERKRKSLQKDADFRRRIELIQDFGFPSAAQTINISGDGRYIIATGTYPPRIRCYDTTELSMKFERYMDATPVATVVISDDYSKLAFMQDDRNIEVHAGYGRHYRTRIPVFGRDLQYHQPTAELLVGAAGSEIYRLNLEEGRFLAPLTAATNGVNKLAVSRITALVAAGQDGGVIEFWDPRAYEKPVARLAAPDAAGRTDGPHVPDVTALQFDEGSLSLAAGLSDGRVLVYDLRNSAPAVTKQHQYRAPVHTVRFHRGDPAHVVSADRHGVRIWRRDTGATFTNIECPAAVNSFTLVSDKPGVGGVDSGLIFVAAESEKVLSYYIPQLGVAPRWCNFLDNISEELEERTAADATGGNGAEAGGTAVYDDYRFVTRDELAALGLSSLIGTPLLRAYMHGYFMDAKLYARVQSVADPHAYERWRKQRVREALEAQRGSRIALDEGLPAVNKELAARLKSEASGAAPVAGAAPRRGHGRRADDSEDEEEEAVDGTASESGSDAEGAARAGTKRGREEAAATRQRPRKADSKSAASGLLADPRFSRLFTDAAFTIDQESTEYLALHPQAPGSSSGGKAAPAAAGRSLSSSKGASRTKADSDAEEADEEEDGVGKAVPAVAARLGASASASAALDSDDESDGGRGYDSHGGAGGRRELTGPMRSRGGRGGSRGRGGFGGPRGRGGSRGGRGRGGGGFGGSSRGRGGGGGFRGRGGRGGR